MATSNSEQKWVKTCMIMEIQERNKLYIHSNENTDVASCAELTAAHAKILYIYRLLSWHIMLPWFSCWRPNLECHDPVSFEAI